MRCPKCVDEGTDTELKEFWIRTAVDDFIFGGLSCDVCGYEIDADSLREDAALEQWEAQREMSE